MRDCRRLVIFVAFPLAIAGLAGCGRKEMSREGVRSEMRAALSISAESQMFIDYVRRGRSTRTYAEGHASYLEDEVKRSVKDLEQPVPAAGTERAVREGLAQLRRLDSELYRIRSVLDNDAALASVEERMGNIHKNLERAQSEL